MLALPPPYHDELLYSVLARHYRCCQPRWFFPWRKTLFGKGFSPLLKAADRSNRNILPNDYLSREVGAIWGKSKQEIIEDHTLFPYHHHFLPSALRTLIEKELFTSDGYSKNWMRLCVCHSPYWGFTTFRYCKTCVEEDFQIFGETYWRRSHQLDGVLVCYRHKEVLLESPAPNGPDFDPFWPNRDVRSDINSFSDLSLLTKKQISCREDDRLLLEEIAQRSHDALYGKRNGWVTEELSKQYRRAAEDAGYVVTRAGRQFARHCREWFGDEFLRTIGYTDLAPEASLRRTFADPSRFSPLLHILVQIFLEYSPDLVRSDKGPRRPRGTYRKLQISIKCPNKFSLHPTHFRIGVGERIVQKNVQSLIATCPLCRTRFSFRPGSDVLCSEPGTYKIIACGTGYIKEARRLLVSGAAKRDIALSLGVTVGTVKRLITGKKNRLEASHSDVLNLRKDWTKTRSTGVARCLRMIDPEWLRAQPKLSRKAKSALNLSSNED